jgi:hypothetical protein
MRLERKPDMESLTDLHDNDAKDEKKNPRPAKHEPEIERVKLGKIESTKVAAWLKQLDEASKGFLQLSKSDLVNFLIRERREELSTKEITLIRANHYDPIRHLNWITPRLKDALGAGDADQIARLQDEIRSIELSVISKATGKVDGAEHTAIPKSKRRRKKDMDLPPQDALTTERLDGVQEAPEKD